MAEKTPTTKTPATEEWAVEWLKNWAAGAAVEDIYEMLLRCAIAGMARDGRQVPQDILEEAPRTPHIDVVLDVIRRAGLLGMSPEPDIRASNWPDLTADTIVRVAAEIRQAAVPRPRLSI